MTNHKNKCPEKVLKNDIPNGGGREGWGHGTQAAVGICWGGGLTRAVLREGTPRHATAGRAMRGEARWRGEATQKANATRPQPSHALSRKAR